MFLIQNDYKKIFHILFEFQFDLLYKFKMNLKENNNIEITELNLDLIK